MSARRVGWAVIVALVCAGATRGRAEERPLMLPTRDVDVTYAVAQPGQPGAAPLSQRLRWTAGTRRLRVDPTTPGLYMVVDYAAHLLSAVRPAEHLVVTLPSDSALLPLGGAPAAEGRASGFTRMGERSVAGVGCTEWRTRDVAGEAAVVCLTQDGVLLRASVGGVARLQAVRVVYGPVEAAAFDIPADYRRVGPAR